MNQEERLRILTQIDNLRRAKRNAEQKLLGLSPTQLYAAKLAIKQLDQQITDLNVSIPGSHKKNKKDKY